MLPDGSIIPVDTFIPPLSESWTNTTAVAPGFNSIEARSILDAGGYLMDETQKLRLNPYTNQPLAMTVLSPARDENEKLWSIGYMLTYYLNAVGIQSTHIALPEVFLTDRALNQREYDILIRDVTLSGAPFGLHALLSSSRDTEGTFAFSGIHDDTLDTALDTLWNGLDETAVKNACLSAQQRLAELLPYVAVCSAPRVSAISAQWSGAVNIPGSGTNNMWTYLLVHQTDGAKGGTYTKGILGTPDTLNPLLADSAAEWEILGQIYYPLFTEDPVTLENTPVLAEKWEIAEWTTPEGKPGMLVTFHLRKDVAWQDGAPFTAKDVKFCADYMKVNNISAFADISDIISEVKATDDTTVEFYLIGCGYHYIYQLARMTVLPQHIWCGITDYAAFRPWEDKNPMNEAMTKLVGTGPYVYQKGALSDGVTLCWNAEFSKSALGKFLLDRSQVNGKEAEGQ
jgi:ABC-type transport system substrate-binding protein